MVGMKIYYKCGDGKIVIQMNLQSRLKDNRVFNSTRKLKN